MQKNRWIKLVLVGVVSMFIISCGGTSSSGSGSGNGGGSGAGNGGGGSNGSSSRSGTITSTFDGVNKTFYTFVTTSGQTSFNQARYVRKANGNIRFFISGNLAYLQQYPAISLDMTIPDKQFHTGNLYTRDIEYFSPTFYSSIGKTVDVNITHLVDKGTSIEMKGTIDTYLAEGIGTEYTHHLIVSFNIKATGENGTSSAEYDVEHTTVDIEPYHITNNRYVTGLKYKSTINAFPIVTMYDMQTKTSMDIPIDTNGTALECRAGDVRVLVSDDGDKFAINCNKKLSDFSPSKRSIYFYTKSNNTFKELNLTIDGLEPEMGVYQMLMSSDGNKIIFKTQSDNIRTKNTNLVHEIFEYDTQTNNIVSLTPEYSPNAPYNAMVEELLDMDDNGSTILYSAFQSASTVSVPNTDNLYIIKNGTKRVLVSYNSTSSLGFRRIMDGKISRDGTKVIYMTREDDRHDEKYTLRMIDLTTDVNTILVTDFGNPHRFTINADASKVSMFMYKEFYSDTDLDYNRRAIFTFDVATKSEQKVLAYADFLEQSVLSANGDYVLTYDKRFTRMLKVAVP